MVVFNSHCVAMYIFTQILVMIKGLHPLYICFTVINLGHDHPTLRDLVIHVTPLVTKKWCELGLLLLDPKYQNEIAFIEGDTRNDEAACCRKMFGKWLNTDELASWSKLIEALRILHLDDEARKIEQLFCKKD